MKAVRSLQGNTELNEAEGYLLLSVNPKIYPLDVVLSAAYIFTEKCYVLVDGDPAKELIVELRLKDTEGSLETIGGEFNNELINYATYAVQALKNERMREAIINRVLATNSECVKETAGSALESSAKPWKLDDPEGIAIPWEDKYGDRKEK